MGAALVLLALSCGACAAAEQKVDPLQQWRDQHGYGSSDPYISNETPVVPDSVEMKRLFMEDDKKKAKRGDAQAQYNLGLYYYGGQVVPKNYAVALKWFQKSAAQGNGFSPVMIGRIYAEGGHGVKRDAAKAEKLLRPAAERGDMLAQLALARLDAQKNPAEALFWYRVLETPRTIEVARQKVFYRQPPMKLRPEDVRAVAGRLTPDERAAVEKRVKEWKPAASD